MRQWLVVGVVVAVVAIFGFLFRDRLTGSPTDVAVGDCVDLPTTDEFSEIQHQPCAEPHDAEVYVVMDWANPPATLPSDAELETWVTDNCLGSTFTDYVGQTYEEATEIGVGWFSPTLDGWSQGDKEMVCYLAPLDGSKVSTSYKKAS